ncbi:MAG: plasma-membrane proton-efflux P-type ATPase [Cuniculiplasma divulgatum]|nr:MAG: plasma-membrane proton-efflux P-type ATPase [Cuniculiplasma divulgatum]
MRKLPDSFDSISAAESLKVLKSTEAGLTTNDAIERRKTYGRNIIEEKKESGVMKLLRKFWAPVPWMLEITAVFTYLIGKQLDTYIIVALLIFNSIISYFQESKADDAVEMLTERVNVSARAVRDGKWNLIPAAELVPGDIVHVRMGDIVPADIKIISGEVLSDQSALTGESEPVRKGKDGRIYSGTVAKGGEATGVVVATGSNTFYGKTTELVNRAKAGSHLESLILSIVKYLAAIDAALVIALIAFAILYGVSILEALPFSLVVLIASIPVALPATFTIATAYGAVDLSRKGALVTRLSAVEDAASMDSICFDKTGTLTQNRISVVDPIAMGCNSSDLIRYAMLASDEASLDSIDMAILAYGKANGIDTGPVTRVKFTPFSPALKRTEATFQINGTTATVTKGAPQVIAQLCHNNDPEEVMSKVRDLSLKGYRSLGVALMNGDERKFCGIIPLHDPPRPDSAKLVGQLEDLGVKARMVTGDSTPIAMEIAREVGIGERICRMADIKAGTVNIDDCDSFAEVFPEDKFTIVTMLQKEGHISGMTGDGVNDAPALKQAEVGIAVASATDVAKASASIVLTHEGISDIVSAVEDGRKIFQRMLTYTLNKIIKTIQVALFLTTSFFIYRFFVTTPFDVILLLFANDFVTMSIATDNVSYSRNPEKWNVRSLVGSSMSLAILILVESFAILEIGLLLGLNVSQIHTFIFDMLVFSGQFTVYMVRSRRRFWDSRPSRWLLTASAADIVAISLISWLGILVTPIPLMNVLLVLLLTFVAMALIDLGKNVIFRHFSI